jgi:hypothetical protein
MPRGMARLALAGMLALAACGTDTPAEPGIDVGQVTGTWALTQLAFDPQGVLPEADILTRLGTSPQLIVTPARVAQLVFQDPVTHLFTTANGKVVTTTSGMRVDFDRGAGYGALLLSRQMTFELQLSFDRNTPVLVFSGNPPDGVNRQRLVGLVQDWQDEQLLDPVPGTLRVMFTRQ